MAMVATVFCRLDSLSLYAKKDVEFWKFVFKYVAHYRQDEIPLRKLQLSYNTLGGEPLKVTTSPVYVPQPQRFQPQPRVQCSFHSIFTWLPKALSLDEIGSNVYIEYAGKELADALRNLPNLEDLELRSTDLVPRDIVFLAQAISKCPNLASLDISDNNVSNGSLKLSEALRYLTNLSFLNLNRTKLGDEGVVSLVGAITCLQSLERLDLSGNGITFQGIYRLTQVLKHQLNMQFLDISSNPIGDLGVLALCAAFQGMPLLQSLALIDCAMGNAGVLLFTLSSKYLPSLGELYIGRNKDIGPEGIAWIFESLTVLKKLKRVDLRDIKLASEKCNERLRRVFKELKWNPQEPVSTRFVDDDSDADSRTTQQTYKMHALDSSGIRKVISAF